MVGFTWHGRRWQQQRQLWGILQRWGVGGGSRDRGSSGDCSCGGDGRVAVRRVLRPLLPTL